MKALFTILILSACVSGCAVRNSAIHGVWVVTATRSAGVSAMSDEEARKWIGRSLSIGDVSSSLEGERVTGCRVIGKKFKAQKFFEDEFKISPSDVGFDDFQLHVFEVRLASGQDWTAPGSTIIVGKKQVLTFWDGEFFVLQRKGPNKSLQPTREGAFGSASRFTLVGPAWLSSSR